MKKISILMASALALALVAVSCTTTASATKADAPAAAAAPKEELVASAAAPLVLKAKSAVLTNGGGEGIVLENGSNVGYWSSVDDTIVWTINVADAGDYSVTVDYAVATEFAGAAAKVFSGDSSVEWPLVKTTGDWGVYKKLELGNLTLAAGETTITMQATAIKNRFVANVKSVTLTKM